jgi:glycosyltransferase involved in cell wall biosynthesis
VIVGNGILEKELKESFGNGNIHFLDFQNQAEMPVVYRMGDVFVLPSAGPGETWGLSVNEAMASSRPVIVSDKCGCAVDLVQNGKNGYTFVSNDDTDLLNRMKLMMDKEKLKRMGEYSKHIIEDWTIQKVCCQIENIVLAK